MSRTLTVARPNGHDHLRYCGSIASSEEKHPLFGPTLDRTSDHVHPLDQSHADAVNNLKRAVHSRGLQLGAQAR